MRVAGALLLAIGVFVTCVQRKVIRMSQWWYRSRYWPVSTGSYAWRTAVDELPVPVPETHANHQPKNRGEAKYLPGL